MAADGTIRIDIDIDSDEIGKANKQLDGMENSSVKASFGLGKIVAALGLVAIGTKAFSMIKEGIKGAFSRIDTMESFERVMTVMTGSTEKASAALENARAVVKGTAYGLDVAAKSVQDFVTRGVSVDKATDRLAAWGDAVAFYGNGSNEQLAGVMDALAKMTTSGKVGMDQMNRLFDAGIDAVGMYAKATGRNAESVQKDLSKGKISAEEFIDTVTLAMMEGTNGVQNIAGAAKDAGASWMGTFDNMQAAVNRGVVNIIQQIDEMLTTNGLPTMREMVAQFGSKFEEVLNKAADSIPVLVEKIKEVYNALEPWAPVIVGVATAFLTFATITSIISGVQAALTAARGAMVLLNAAMVANPVGAVIAILAGLVAAVVLAYEKFDWFRDIVDNAWSKIKDATSGAVDYVKDKLAALKEFWTTNGDSILSNVKEKFEKVKETISNVVKDVVSFVKSQLDKFKAFWDENGQAIMILVKGHFNHIAEIVKGVMGVIKGVFEVVWPIISGVVKIAWNLIKTIVSTAIDVVLGVVQTALKLLQGDWKGAWDTIKTTVEKIWSNIVKFFGDVDLVSVGKDIINGLIKGLKSMVTAVADTVKGIGNNIKSTFKKLLDINSPSGEFEEFGINIGEGLEIGLVKSGKDAVTTMASIGGSLIKTMTEIGATAIDLEDERSLAAADKLINWLLSRKEGAVCS